MTVNMTVDAMQNFT